MTTPDLQALIELSDDDFDVAAQAYADVFDGMPGSHAIALRYAIQTLRANHSTLTAPTLPGAGGGGDVSAVHG